MGKVFKIRMNERAMDALHAVVTPDLSQVRVKVSDKDGSVQIGTVRFQDLRDISNPEAEAALLGALMIVNKLTDEVNYLRSEHFYFPLHARIYEAIQKKVANAEVANPVTLKRQFDGDEDLEQFGGAAYLAQLTGSGAAVIGARDFANQIVELHELRRARAAMLKAVDRVEDTNAETPIMEIIGDLEAELADTVERGMRKGSVTAGQAADEAAKVIEETSAGKAPAGFLLHGFEDYNHVRGRMEGGDLDLLGGRPSMGKTAISLRIARGAAEAGIGTEYLSLEMKRDKITRRILADMIYRQGHSCTYQQLIEGRLSRDDWRSLAEAKDRLGELPFSISDDEMMIEDLAPFLRKRKRWFANKDWELKFVVLDYLGRLSSRRKFSSETELTGYISRTLKSVAKELDVCLLALAQLNRGLEQRENKRPMLSDLRQSGSLEQDADNVIFIYRDEYYLEKVEPDRSKLEKWNKWADEINQVRDDVEIFSSKRREGALSKRIAKFYMRHQAVRDHGDYAAAPTFFDDDDPAQMPEVRG